MRCLFHLSYATVSVDDADVEGGFEQMMTKEVAVLVRYHARLDPVAVRQFDACNVAVLDGSGNAELGVARETVRTRALIEDITVSRSAFPRGWS